MIRARSTPHLRRRRLASWTSYHYLDTLSSVESDLDNSEIWTSEIWPSEWLRGFMEVCVLRVIADGPTYGYAIASALEVAGLGSPKGGTLYPLLGRLEHAHWVKTYWGAGEGGPGRKFYQLTDAGRDHLNTAAIAWAQFSHRLTSLLADPPPDSAGQAQANSRTTKRRTDV